MFAKKSAVKGRWRRSIAALSTFLVAITGVTLTPTSAEAALAYSFDSWTFTPCGATGRSGPSLADCQTAYSSSSFASNSSYFMTDGYGMQMWKPPVAGNYTIELAGAGGGGSNGGKGHVYQYSINIAANSWVCFQVGQKGVTATNFSDTGGGGGSTTINTSNTSTTSCSATYFVGGGGGGGNTPGKDAASKISYQAGSTTGVVFSSGGNGRNAGSGVAGNSVATFSTTCTATGGPLTGGSNGNNCSSNFGGNTSIGYNVAKLPGAGGQRWTFSPKVGGGTFGLGLGGEGGFPDGGASCGCSTNGGGGGGGGGGINADGTTGGGGGGASYVPGQSLNQAISLGSINSGDGYVKITYDFAVAASTRTAISKVSGSTSSNAVGDVISATAPTFSQAGATAPASVDYQWQLGTQSNLPNEVNQSDFATWTDIPGATSQSFTIPIAAAGQFYRAVVIVTTPSGYVLEFTSFHSTQIAYTHSITTTSVPDGALGSTYTFTFRDSFTAVANTVTWALNSGSLPPGLTLTSGGVLGGNPSAAGTYTFSVRSTTSYSTEVSQSYTMTIHAAGSFSAATPPAAVSGSLYSYQFQATLSNGATPTYSLASGTLPPQLTLSSSGVLSGLTPMATANANYNFAILASDPSNSNVKAQTSTITFTVSGRTLSSTPITSSMATASFNMTTPPTSSFTFAKGATGTGLFSYTTTTPTICSVTSDGVSSPVTVVALLPGTCTVRLLQEADATVSGTYTNVSWTINRITDSSIVMSATSPVSGGVLTWSPTDYQFTVSGSGGLGTAPISYSTNSPGCTIDSATGLVTVFAPGTCTITATRTTDVYYGNVGGTLVVTVTGLTQDPVYIANVPSQLQLGSALTLIGTGGSLSIAATASYSYASSTTTVCTVGASTGVITTLKVGTCTVTATSAANGMYPQRASNAYSFWINGTDQPPLVMTVTSTQQVTRTIGWNLVSGGGTATSSSPTVTVDPASASVCRVNGTGLSSGSLIGDLPGTCTFTVTYPATGIYNPVSATLSATFTKATQGAITFTTPAQSFSEVTQNWIASSFTQTTPKTGLTPTYSVSAESASICSVGTDGKIYALGAGNCVVTITVPGNAIYLDQTATSTSVISKGTQSQPTISANRTTLSASDTTPLVVTGAGGNGTGAFTYSVTSGSTVCSVNSSTGVVTSLAFGTCSISARREADANYNVSAWTPSPITISVTKLTQAAFTASSSVASGTFGGSTFTVSTSGGSGNGSISWVNNSTSVCSLSSTSVAIPTVTVLSAGTCTVTATKATDSNYLAASSTVNITIDRANQATLTATTTKSTVNFGATSGISVSATGGSGAGSISYASNDSSVCTIASTGGAVTVLSVGSCVINATKSGGTNYNDVTASVTITVLKIAQSAVTVTPNSATAIFNDGLSYSVSASGGSTSNAFVYSSNSASICTVDSSTGEITVLGAGICSISALRPADVNYEDATGSTVITIAKANQSNISVNADNVILPYTESPKQTAQVSYTGGSGTGSVAYSTSTPSVCAVDATGLVTNITAGRCTIVVTIAADANYNQASGSILIRFGKVAQSALSVTASSVSVAFADGSSITVSSSGGSGTGSTSYSTSSAGCSVDAATGVVTITGAGDCVIVATKATDLDYNQATSTVTISVAKGTQSSLSASVDNSSVTYLDGTTVTVSSSGGSGTGSISYSTSSTTCSVNANTGVITIIGAGACVVVATKAADANYNLTTASATLTVAKSNQGALSAVASRTSATYGDGLATTVSISGGSGTGAVTYSSSDVTVCSVNSTTGAVTIVSAGACVITAAKAADANYLASSNNVTIAIAKANQASVTASKSGNTTYGSATVVTVSLSGGSGTGAVSFASNTTSVCSVDSATGVITIVTAGTCTIEATKLADANYVAVSSSVSINIAKAAQATFSASKSSDTTYGSVTVVTVSATGGSGTGNVTFTSTTAAVCSVDANSGVITIVTAGTCSVTATKATDVNYLVASNSVSVTISKATQSTLTASRSSDTTYGSALVVSVSTTGGSGNGSVTYVSTTTGVCTVNSISGVITIVTAGSCSITATKAADTNYNVATGSVTIAIAKANQSSFSTTTNHNSPTYGDGVVITATSAGGSGAGAIAYSTASSTCSVNSSTGLVTVISVGQCAITATKAADTNYNLISATVTINIARASQSNLSLAKSGDTTYGSAAVITVTVSGVLGTGSVTYGSSTTNVCLVNSVTGVVTILTAGTCTANVVSAGDVNYFSASKTVSINIAKASQAGTTISATYASVVFDSGSVNTVTLNGGSGTGAISYSSTTASVCSVNQSSGVVAVITAGTCTISATKAADTNYFSTSANISFTINKAAQAPLSVSASSGSTTFGSATSVSISTTGGTGTGALSYSSETSSTCSVDASSGVITVITAGTCQIRATRAADINYTAVSGTAVVTINKANQAAITVSSNITSVTYRDGSTISVSYSGGSGTGAFTYTSVNSSVCTVAANGAVTVLTAGNCAIQATRAADINYLVEQSSTTISIAKAAQTALQASANDVIFDSSFPTTPITLTGGSGTGSVTYSVDAQSNGICSVSASGRIASLAAGTCVINISRAADINYNAATTSVSMRISKGIQAALTTSGSTALTFAAPTAATSQIVVGGGSSTGSTSYSLDPASVGICSVSSTGLVAALQSGSCVVNISKAGDAFFLDASTTFTISIAKAAQAAFTGQAQDQLTYDAVSAPTTTLLTQGGSGSGLVTFSSTSSACSINGSTLTALTAGSCVVTATKATDNQYLARTVTFTVVIAKAVQVTLQATPGTLNLKFSPTRVGVTELAVSGGSGSGAITYAVAASSNAVCSVDSTVTPAKITALAAGTCVVNVTKNSDSNYLGATTSTSIQVIRTNQDPLVLTSDVKGGLSGQIANLSVTGGSGNGAVRYEVVSGVNSCILSGETITFDLTGTCIVMAIKEAEGNYDAVESNRLTFTVTKSEQQQLTVTVTAQSLPHVALGGRSKTVFEIAGGSGTGSVQISKVTGCLATLAGNKLNVSAGTVAGDCVIDIVKAEDDNFAPTTYRQALKVFNLPAAPAIQTPTLTDIVTADGLGVRIGWDSISFSPLNAPVTGYQVQTKTGSNWVEADGGNVTDANQLSALLSVTPWTSIFVRVRAITEYDDPNNLTWSTFGGATPQAFNVPGRINTLSMTSVSAGTPQTIVISGAGFNANTTKTVQLKADLPIIKGSGTKTVGDVTLPATVLSPTSLSFTYPGGTLPRGVTNVKAAVAVNGANSMQTNFANLELTGAEVTFDLGLNVKSFKFVPKITTIFAGSLKWTIKANNGEKIFSVKTCTKYSGKKCVKFKVADSATCVTSQALPINKKSVRRTITFATACVLNAAGKAIMKSPDTIDVTASRTYVKLYPTTGLNYILVGKKKTQVMRPSVRSYLFHFGNMGMYQGW